MTLDSWPPENGLFTPTVPRSDVIISIYGSSIINAPAPLVWEILRDTSKYPEWNSFVPDVTIISQPDGSDSQILQKETGMVFNCIMNPAKPSSINQVNLRVNDFSTPDAPSHYVADEMLQDPAFTSDLSKVYRIAWKVEGGLVSRGLRSERFHEIIILDDGKCEVRNWECMGGILARTIKWMYSGTLPDRTQDWTNDLKRECERRAAESS